MTVVGAYIELKPWETAPLNHQSLWAEGEVHEKTDEGIDVTWWDEFPPGAQVYVEWNPRVYAIWEEEDVEHGTETEPAGQDDPEEPDEGSGSSGEGAGEESVARPEEPDSSE